MIMLFACLYRATRFSMYGSSRALVRMSKIALLLNPHCFCGVRKKTPSKSSGSPKSPVHP